MPTNPSEERRTQRTIMLSESVAKELAKIPQGSRSALVDNALRNIFFNSKRSPKILLNEIIIAAKEALGKI